MDLKHPLHLTISSLGAWGPEVSTEFVNVNAHEAGDIVATIMPLICECNAHVFP